MTQLRPPPVRRYPEQPVPSYELSLVDQWEPIDQVEILPADPALRRAWSRSLAVDAVVYGLPAALQYAEMYAQTVDRTGDRYTGFNAFAHDRALAGPDYVAFTTPNADTLYSNAWLDLGDGPVLLDLPPFGARYYTANFLDMYSNATNLSTRTVGPDGGRFLVATTDWAGEVPDGASLFRVATRHMWILLRIFVDGTDADLAEAHRLQDRVTLTPIYDDASDSEPPAFPAATPATVRSDWRIFFAALDAVLRTSGRPVQDDALTYRFRSLGIGGRSPFDADALDEQVREGLREGFADGMALVQGCRAQLGNPIPGAGWNRGTAGAYGLNYLRRAAANHVGLGATTPVENQAFTTFRDAAGEPLDGTRGDYAVELAPPPPVGAFWSLTVYDARTQALVPNELGRHVVNSATPGLRYDAGGSLRLTVSAERPVDPASWLPAPAGPFYVVIRAYLPLDDVRAGRWQPRPVRRLPIAE
ncbi:DUF1254 domain-containing protein [Geodermatophilus sp. URMC 64]